MNLFKLETIFKSQPSYRLKQANLAIFVNLINSWEEATNLPKELREILDKECPLEIKAKILASQNGSSAKAIVHLGDGNLIETVLMRHKDGRHTVCVSSQVGCPLACEFCLTGERGFKRNLTAWEIVEQVVLFARYLKKEKKKVTNIVFMGMGEPFLNYSEVIKAAYLINDKDKLNIGARHISISTVGLADEINKFSHEPLQINLAISLHASNDLLRSRLMRINKKYSIAKILKATTEYINKTNRRVMIEYIMLDGVNDSEDQARELARLLKESLEKLFFVNLITYNPTDKYKPSGSRTINRFKNILEKERIDVVQRFAFGREIKGACGQLGKAILKRRI